MSDIILFFIPHFRQRTNFFRTVLRITSVFQYIAEAFGFCEREFVKLQGRKFGITVVSMTPGTVFCGQFECKGSAVTCFIKPRRYVFPIARSVRSNSLPSANNCVSNV